MKFLIKLIILIVIVGAGLTYLGYTIDFDISKTNSADSNLETGSESEESELETESETEAEPTDCDFNSDCTSGLLCIDGTCGEIADLYETDCDATCSITGVLVSTSDGEEYNIKLGQGSYSMAGALTWKLLTTPKYCSGNPPLVPIKLSSRSGGEIVGENIITLREDEISEPISHALAEEPTFTVSLDNITEECS